MGDLRKELEELKRDRLELRALRKLAEAVDDMRGYLEAERSIHPALDSGQDADAVLRALDKVHAIREREVDDA